MLDGLLQARVGPADELFECPAELVQRPLQARVPPAELRDRTGEGQHYRVAGLNLLAAIIIYWNTLKLGEAVFAGRKAGLAIPAEFLAHVSPLGWEHINLTGEYRWPRTGSTGSAKPLAARGRSLFAEPNCSGGLAMSD